MIAPYSVPDVGPLEDGAVYARADMHGRFGGNSTAGIVPSKREQVVLLFHTTEPSQQFYNDGLDADGIYWYSGMGVRGDMQWNYAKRSVLNHLKENRDLLFFERA